LAAGHGLGDALYRPGTSAVHHLAPECKLVATVAFVFAVVSTPREALWAYALHAAIVLAVAVAATVPLRELLRRMVIEVPFVAFAFFLPIVGRGERVRVAGVSLSAAGLWAAWNILAKGTLGVATSVLLAATTPVTAVLKGMERLRVPKVLVAICGFMVRYADVISGEMQRMRVARESRGHDPRWIWQVRAVAASAGALFVRSYERGERVYLAMASRGYTGTMPELAAGAHEERRWALALAMPAAAAAVSAAAWVVR
jgi:cobalt/nickel transport system permease protein